MITSFVRLMSSHYNHYHHIDYQLCKVNVTSLQPLLPHSLHTYSFMMSLYVELHHNNTLTAVPSGTTNLCLWTEEGTLSCVFLTFYERERERETCPLTWYNVLMCVSLGQTTCLQVDRRACLAPKTLPDTSKQTNHFTLPESEAEIDNREFVLWGSSEIGVSVVVLSV